MTRRLSGLRGLRCLLASTNCPPPPEVHLSRHFWRRAPAQLDPPIIQARPETRHCAGQEWQDEYSWLESGAPEVQLVLEAERRHAQRWLRRCEQRATQLRAAMLDEVPEEQVSIPERVGGHEYFVEQLVGGPHPCYKRRAVAAAPRTVHLASRPREDSSGGRDAGGGRRGEDGSAEVVLDLNELAAVHGEHVQVGQMKLSRCGQRVAFTLDTGTGEECFQAFTRDLTTGTLRHLGMLGGVVSLEWAADSRTLLATQPNELGRPWRVLACDVGAADTGGSAGSWATGGRWRGGSGGSGSSRGGPASVWPVFEDSDERFFVELGRTKDWSFLTINCNSKASSEVHLLPASLPAEQWWASNGSASSSSSSSSSSARPAGTSPLVLVPRVVQPRQDGLEYFVEHNGGQLYILSNARGAENYAVYRVPADAAHLGQEHWQVVVPEQAGTANEDMDMARDWLVLYQRVQGRQQVAALPLLGGLPAGAGRGGAGAAGAAAERNAPGAAAAGTAAAAAGAAARAAADTAAEVSTAAEAAAGAAAWAGGGAGFATASAHAAAAAEQAQLHLAPLPGWALSVTAGANADFESSSLRLMLSSPVHPEATFDWEMSRQRMLCRAGGPAGAAWTGAAPQQGNAAAAAVPVAAVSGGLAAEQAQRRELTWRQLWATSADGTAVPLTVAHTEGLFAPDNSSQAHSSDTVASPSPGPGPSAKLSPRPCLLVVYGAYGHCLPTEFTPERLPLLWEGWVLALAHVRGGGELGRRWHAAGRGPSKPSSVADLEACLDLLISAGYTRPGLVALEAHSAGGLTAGALLNRRPSDVGAALLEAPFVDVLSAMCRPELPLTVHEYDEWGDPRHPQQFGQIARLCPYHNVPRAAAYPPTLLTCSQADLRVPFWGPLKHVARLRAAMVAAAQQGDDGRGGSGGGGGSCSGGGKRSGPILLLPDEQAGHFVHERERFSTKALQYAFLEAALQGWF